MEHRDTPEQEFTVTLPDVDESAKDLIIRKLKQMGCKIVPKVEKTKDEIQFLSEPVSDLTEDIESYRFTVGIKEGKLYLLVSDALSLREPLIIEIFITADRLQAWCNGSTFVIKEDIGNTIYE